MFINWNWQEEYKKKLTTPDEAVKIIKDGDRVVIGQAAAMPGALDNAFAKRKELKGVTAITALALRPIPFMSPKTDEYVGHIDTLGYFMGPQDNAYDAAHGGVSSVNFNLLDKWVPEIAKPNVLLLEVTPPDAHGYFNVGNVNACMLTQYREYNPVIVVQVNKNVPFQYGENVFIHVSEVEAIVEFDEPMPQLPFAPATDLENKIASHIVDLIPDGACLQIGLGGIGNAVGYSLEHKKDLGVWTEMATDSMIHLAKKGVINGSKMTTYPGKFVAAMGLGSQEMYDFMNHNPFIYALPLYKITGEQYIAQNDNFVSINNCLSTDLTGQICSETIGHKRVSTTGGQQGFVRGAIRSTGGKSFILLASTAKDKDGNLLSRISLNLAPGTIVSTPRSDVQYIGTEWGCVNVFGLPPAERAKKIITIAHPDFREQLTEEAKKAGILK
ncbi:hypothetical protein LQZ18_05305 [Lachnospiraceae bacterium ZAX-1]